jgi:hypothetical protein
MAQRESNRASLSKVVAMRVALCEDDQEMKIETKAMIDDILL